MKTVHTLLQMWSCLGGNTDQSFALVNYHRHWVDANGDTNKCIDVVNGTGVRLWDCVDDNTNQMFAFKNGALQWIGSSVQCLDVTSGSTTNGTPVQICDCVQDSPNQLFTAVSH